MPIRFDKRTLKYRTAGGRVITRRQLVGALEVARERTRRDLLAFGQLLRDGTINPAQFTIQSVDALRALHVLAGGIAVGGRANLTAGELGRIGSITKAQYKFFRRLVRQVASGEQLFNGTLDRRLAMYADASRATFALSEQVMFREAGYTEERNVLYAKESCQGCEEETALGWVEIGTLKPVGGRDCLSNCLCEIEYRKGDDLPA